MSDDFKAKLRSLNFGTPRSPRSTVDGDGNKRTELIRDDDGRSNGWNTEHASGRVDAQVFVDAPAITPNSPELT